MRQDEEVANEAAEAANGIRKECEAELNLALPLLEEATAALNTIKQDDIVFIKAMKNPPQGVKLVMEAVCVLLVGHLYYSLFLFSFSFSCLIFSHNRYFIFCVLPFLLFLHTLTFSCPSFFILMVLYFVFHSLSSQTVNFLLEPLSLSWFLSSFSLTANSES